MVQGIEKFKEKFSNYLGQYVFIEGTPYSLLISKFY